MYGVVGPILSILESILQELLLKPFITAISHCIIMQDITKISYKQLCYIMLLYPP